MDGKRKGAQCVSQFLNCETEFILSSNLQKNNDLKGQDKIIHICDLLGAQQYVNPIGGIDLYTYDTFKNNNIDLKYLKSSNIKYSCPNLSFIPNLSIIYVLMNSSKDKVKQYLIEFDLI